MFQIDYVQYIYIYIYRERERERFMVPTRSKIFFNEWVRKINVKDVFYVFISYICIYCHP